MNYLRVAEKVCSSDDMVIMQCELSQTFWY